MCMPIQTIIHNLVKQYCVCVIGVLFTTHMQLCSTKYGRLYLKSKQVYLIMRELHKSEEDPDVQQTCEALVSILISDEPEPGMENLHEVELPDDS